MARKTRVPKIVLKLPWWVDLALAVLVYYGLKYWVPTLYFQNAQLNRFMHALPQFAELFALILLVNGIFSAWHAWRKEK
ncbi:MAG TPA: hypothetical protein VIM41_14560 [Gammaproteobacteria bacterium]